MTIHIPSLQNSHLQLKMHFLSYNMLKHVITLQHKSIWPTKHVRTLQHESGLQTHIHNFTKLFKSHIQRLY